MELVDNGLYSPGTIKGFQYRLRGPQLKRVQLTEKSAFNAFLGGSDSVVTSHVIQSGI